MPADIGLTWAYTEEFIPEDDIISDARLAAEEHGITPVSPGTGATLRSLAAAAGARSVAEIGTGTGVSGLWLLGGMTQGGMLTTIDVDSTHQQEARRLFDAAGYRHATRLISSRACDMLPRMAARAYDMVLLDIEPEEAALVLDQALVMVRPGGILAIPHALRHGKVADPTKRDPRTVAAREIARSLREREDLITGLLPCGDGLLTAVVR